MSESIDNDHVLYTNKPSIVYLYAIDLVDAKDPIHQQWITNIDKCMIKFRRGEIIIHNRNKIGKTMFESFNLGTCRDNVGHYIGFINFKRQKTKHFDPTQLNGYYQIVHYQAFIEYKIVNDQVMSIEYEQYKLIQQHVTDPHHNMFLISKNTQYCSLWYIEKNDKSRRQWKLKCHPKKLPCGFFTNNAQNLNTLTLPLALSCPFITNMDLLYKHLYHV